MDTPKTKQRIDPKTRLVLSDIVSHNRQCIIEKQKHGRGYIPKNSKKPIKPPTQKEPESLDEVLPLPDKASKSLNSFVDSLEDKQISIDEAISKAKDFESKEPNFIEKVILLKYQIQLALINKANQWQEFYIDTVTAHEERRAIKDLIDGNQEIEKYIFDTYDLKNENNKILN